MTPRDFRLIYDRSFPGAEGYRLPENDVPERPLAEMIPGGALRSEAPRLPEVPEPEVVRHYVRISTFNHHVDKAIYPLGSCTMKYNPKVNEDLARLPGLAGLHPMAPPELVQGMLGILHRFTRELAAVVGMDTVSLHPAAGAQGELLGIRLARAYHDAQGNKKKVVLIPDSAHGTNPATAHMVGYETRELKSRPDGRLDIAALREAVNAETAALMVTNPNTLGHFESEIREAADILHSVDGLLYMDGANLNAMLGLTRPGDMGADMVHINLHKTFSTPHGGGGPGAGPVGVKAKLIPFLPAPVIEEADGRFYLDTDRPRSVGRLHPYAGNVGMILRAFAYLRSLGSDGLAEISRAAIVNANYLMKLVEADYPVAYPGPCMHEFVVSCTWMKKHGVKNIDVAKRLLDFGVHAPTVSFPLIVHDCLMIEPTESESRTSLDEFAGALRQIAREVREQPEIVTGAPHDTPVRRLDEGAAARNLIVRWEPKEKE
ncbi:MAG: aminomethyl-transferring glycine dehydrogenase subunit GcvPB [Candidatus Eisenbacteria bacterium]|nr:aminomethyl-transferring glycine dehydrogenase subunit GcvPB [Candidatus Eisenbacteria bacterium]